MQSYLEIAEPFLLDSLVTHSTMAQLHHISSFFPPLPRVVFESHLNSNARTVDYLLATTPNKQLLAYLRNPKFANNNLWQIVRQFCDFWQHSSKQSMVKWMWFEFDTSCPMQAEKITPGIFFVEGFQYLNPVALPIIETFLEKLFGHRLNEQTVKNLERCLSSLPQTSYLFALGNMFGRRDKSIRVSLGDIPIDQLAVYLDRIGWPGSIDELSYHLKLLQPFFYKLSLDLDVSETIGPNIGLELYQEDKLGRSNWEKSLNYLVELNLCLPEKQEALLSWPGYKKLGPISTNMKFLHLSLMQQNLNTPSYFGFNRYINHIKVAYKPGQPLQAKAYLAFQLKRSVGTHHYDAGGL